MLIFGLRTCGNWQHFDLGASHLPVPWKLTAILSYSLALHMHVQCVCTKTSVSGIWKVIDHRGRVPTGVQVVVSLQAICRCPQLVQVRVYVLRVGSQSRVELRNWHVSHFHFLPGLCFILLD
jgi:hypothetical protein